jgi:RNA polymerase sigma factor (sigma-70 family)
MANAENNRVNIDQVLAELKAGINQDQNFSILFCLYYDLIFRFFVKKGFSPDECHQLTQDTFLQLYRSLNELDEEAQFEMWMLEVASALAASASGSRAQQRPQSNHPMNNEEHEGLRRVVATLPNQMRKCLLLWVEQEMSIEEISSALKIPAHMVESYLRAVQIKLKETVTRLSNSSATKTPRR